MKRSAPETGYDFGNKGQYRRNVWATFRAAARRQGWARSACDVLLMPSIEGKEIEVAEAAGFSRYRMHVVDENPAIVAVLQRRYPGINTYGVTVARAAKRLATNGIKLKFANLDFCGQVAPRLSHELFCFASAGCLDDSLAYMAVTMLRGRENQGTQDYLCAAMGESLRGRLNGKWRDVLSKLSEWDTRRVLFIGSHLAYRGGDHLVSTVPIRCESYRSTAGTQTMLWSVWQVQNCYQIGLSADARSPGRFTAIESAMRHRLDTLWPSKNLVRPLAVWKVNPNLEAELSALERSAKR